MCSYKYMFWKVRAGVGYFNAVYGVETRLHIFVRLLSTTHSIHAIIHDPQALLSRYPCT
jgi:hypothetical protein